MSGRLRYTEPSFTMPTNVAKISDLEYKLRVGSITQAEYDRAAKAKNGVGHEGEVKSNLCA